jgi:multimeric flavodoxin WrbA
MSYAQNLFLVCAKKKARPTLFYTFSAIFIIIETNRQGGTVMKVLMLNGSANPIGCTKTALEEVGKALEEQGVEYEIFQLDGGPLRDCIGCRQCKGNRCIFQDDQVNEFMALAEQADGFVFGTPVYYAHPTGRIFSFLDRVFYCTQGCAVFRGKPGAAVASARRAGTTASLDAVNKYFMIAQMPVVSSNYWNMVHGNNAQEVMQDKEGLQIMRNLGRNMAWMLRCIACGKEQGILFPEAENGEQTNFIR